MTSPQKVPPSLEAEATARERSRARDPRTPATELRALAERARHGERRLAAALAANPATPFDVLTVLIPLAPAAFCRNPITVRILTEDRYFLRKVSPIGVAQLLRCPRLPAAFLDQILNSPQYFAASLREAASLHISYVPLDRATEDWRVSICRYWRRIVARIDMAWHAVALYEAVEQQWLPPGLLTGLALADSDAPPTSATVLRTLTQEQAFQMLEGVKNPPLERHISDSPWPYRYIGAAFGARVPSHVLETWAGHNQLLDCAIAQSRYVSPELLKRFAGSSYIPLRRAAFQNPRFPIDQRAIVQQRAIRQAALLTSYGKFYRRSEEPIPLAYLLLRFAALLQLPDPIGRPLWNSFARSWQWQERLAAAAAIRDRPSGKPPRLRHLALLRQLAADGNAMVCAAAEGRLRGEAFSWDKMPT